MILRPQRYRTLMGFLLGLSLSLIVLGIGYAYYHSTVTSLGEKEKLDIQKQAVEEYIQNNPTSLVYVVAKEKKAGEVLTDSDLIPAEISQAIIPSDAVTDIAMAAGKVIRCDVTANTAITRSLIYEEGDYPDDMRLMEYTVINLPQKLEAQQFVDVRIMFPNGLDYIVLSKKQITDLQKATENQKSILWFHAGEEEILRMASAIVDASVVEGSLLYAVPYVAPDVQKEAIRTYPSNGEVQSLITQNPNIVNKAITALEIRNREVFEDRINKDRQNFGKNRVYGEDTTPVTPTTAATPEPQLGGTDSAMDGRL